MTKEQLIEKCSQLFAQVTENMPKDLDKLLNSGGVDYESADNDFILPKKILCTILMEEQFQYKPHGMNDKENRKNKKEIEIYYNMI